MIKIINNVLTLEDSFSLYEALISQNLWRLDKKSENTLAGSFPGVEIVAEGKGCHFDNYWIGYFNCLFDRINQKLKEQHNFSMGRNILSIGLNAQNENHYTAFHKDADDGYSIVGFLTPQWAEEWGGELNIEGEIMKYKPGDFIIFNSNQLHKSQKINKKIPYWRVTVSYVVKKSNT